MGFFQPVKARFMMVTGRLNSVFGLIPNVEKIAVFLKLSLTPTPVFPVTTICALSHAGNATSDDVSPPFVNVPVEVTTLTYQYGFTGSANSLMNFALENVSPTAGAAIALKALPGEVGQAAGAEDGERHFGARQLQGSGKPHCAKARHARTMADRFGAHQVPLRLRRGRTRRHAPLPL